MARILIVDDHPLIRSTVRTLLDAHSFEVCGEAEDGKGAIEKAMETRPDIVLLDISMPVMDGFEAAQELRRILPSTKIVFLTMLESAGFREKARLWSHAFVPKSSAGIELIPTVKKLLKESPQQNHDYTYPWQCIVMEAFSSPRKTLAAKINLAERTIAARLMDDEVSREERLAIKRALTSLRQLISETRPSAEKSGDKTKGAA